MDPDYVLFAKVADSGSFSAAGAELGISPAMMSKRIARLEARLGTRLLHRTTRKLALTQTGAQLHRDIGAIMIALQAAEDRATNRARVPSGPLRVSAPTSFGRLHIAPLVASFLQLHPDVELELNLTDAYVELLAERFDLAVRVTSEVPTSLQGHYLAANRRILCASPAYLDRYGTPSLVSDLADHRLLAAEGQMPWRLTSSAKRMVVEGKSAVRTNSSEIVRELAITGLGIALRSLWDVGDLLAQGRLVPILEEWHGPDDLAIYAVHLKAPGRPAAVDAFVGFLRDAFASAPWNAARSSAAAGPQLLP
jgi:DNA-binding transcriptional LysR family regulator